MNSKLTAQSVNIKLTQLSKLKQLEFHPDKPGFVLLGREQNVMRIRKEIEEHPIYCDNAKNLSYRSL